MREIIKHRGAKVKLSDLDIEEIVGLITTETSDFELISDMYNVQSPMIKDLFYGKKRFSFLLGTERFFAMQEAFFKRKKKEDREKKPNKSKGIFAYTQERINEIYTRAQTERGKVLCKEYDLQQSTISKLKHNKLKTITGHLIEYKTKPEKSLADLAMDIKQNISVVLYETLPLVLKHRLDQLDMNNPLVVYSKEKLENNLFTGFRLSTIFKELCDYSPEEILLSIQEIKIKYFGESHED